jgi:hypothetical protein
MMQTWMKTSVALLLCLSVLALYTPDSAHAQAGPPFLSNDPGTPGNGNWEINIASAHSGWSNGRTLTPDP